MDEKIGSVSYHDSTGAYQGILGKPYSEEMGQRIDKKVGNLIDMQYEKARAILIEHRDQLEALAALLLEKEEADIEDLERIMGKRKM